MIEMNIKAGISLFRLLMTAQLTDLSLKPLIQRLFRQRSLEICLSNLQSVVLWRQYFSSATTCQ